MAREIPKIDWVPYVPAAFENRSDPDPITCEIHYLTADESRRYDNMLKVKAKRNGELDVKNKDKVNCLILTECVRNIKNYKVGGVGIVDGATLFSHGEKELRDELLEVVENYGLLEEGAVKNFEPQSVS